MTRTVKDANLETRAARERLKRLKPQRQPYWRAIASGMHLGYRSGARGGVWIARFYVAAARKYHETTLGRADDTLDADGVAALSFTQAQEKARGWFAAQARIAAGLEPLASGPYTVADAMRDYLTNYTERGGKSLQETEIKIRAFILPTLGAIPVASLTTKRLRDWLHGIAASPARVRTSIGDKQQHRKSDGSDEAKRKRRASANRILATFKAALNHAWREEGKVASDMAWRTLRPFANASAPVVRHLSEDECVRLINCMDEEFKPVARAALLTGCRLGELLGLRSGDFNGAAGTLAIRASKSGKARHVVVTDEGRSFFAAVTAGKLAGAPVFTRADGSKWSRNAQQRPMIEACQRAHIVPPVSFHVLRHTHASILAMKGVEMAVVGAQLGHAPGSKMTAKHYAHLGPSYIADKIRASFPTLGITGESNVTPLWPKRHGHESANPRRDTGSRLRTDDARR